MGSSRYRRNGVRGERERAGSEGRDRRGRARYDRVLAIALTLLALACGGTAKKIPVAPPAEPEVDFTVIDSPSLQFLPRHQEAQGWRLEEDPIVVPGERINTYLGADGAHFTRYELLDVTSGKYASTKDPGFAIVEIFRFPDFVKAFGAYSMRKEAVRAFIPVQNEGYVSKFAVHVWRGPFYIRVTGGATNAFQSLTQLASFVAERMPAASSKPAVFAFFPNDTRVPNSERYSADKGFGQAILGNSFQATFNVAGDVIDGLIIPAANKATAAKILDLYRALYVRNGKLMDPIANLGEDNFTAEDKYLGRVVAYRIDRFVIAFNGFKDRQKLVDLAAATDARILGSIRKQLVIADKEAEAPPRQNPNQPPWARPQPRP
ncbi:MAG TPA: DUF6599 family protein [Thermoanaerobaculia bacterium]|nr:DUF6599 family protein [Thermoanaerobaculia bacterium]